MFPRYHSGVIQALRPAWLLWCWTILFLYPLSLFLCSPLWLNCLSHPHLVGIPQGSESSPLLALFAFLQSLSLSASLSCFPQERTLMRSHDSQISHLHLSIRALGSSVVWWTMSIWIIFQSQTPVCLKWNLLFSLCQTGSALSLLPPTKLVLKSWSHTAYSSPISNQLPPLWCFFLQNSPRVYSFPFNSCYFPTFQISYYFISGFLDSWPARLPLGSPLLNLPCKSLPQSENFSFPVCTTRKLDRLVDFCSPFQLWHSRPVVFLNSVFPTPAIATPALPSLTWIVAMAPCS